MVGGESVAEFVRAEFAQSKGRGSVIKSPRTPRPVGRSPMARSSGSPRPTVRNWSRPVRASLSTPRAP